jgi:predicted site-specific integrase-resolvase
MSNINYKTAAEVKKMFRITGQTLHNWRKNGQIKFNQINCRHILYDIESVDSFNPAKTPRINIIYSRVSQIKQKPDLERQSKLLSDFANTNGYVVGKIYEEIASGMNENRPKLNEIIDMVTDYKVNKIFLTYKDRLSRFGFGYLENLFKKYNTEIIILNEDHNGTFEEEMSQDLISIIHYFSMKMYSNRRKLLSKIKKELETE